MFAARLRRAGFKRKRELGLPRSIVMQRKSGYLRLACGGQGSRQSEVKWFGAAFLDKRKVAKSF